jgi:tetratricopeptide (TPR) repeat protein
MLGVASYRTGEFATALAYEDRAAKRDDDVQCTHENPIGGGDPAIVCRGYAVMSFTALGLLEESVSWSEKAWAIANSRGHAFSIAWAGLVRTRSLNPIGRDAESIDVGNLCADICERHGFNARLGNVLVFRGAARVATGEPGEGLADMRHGLAQGRRACGTFHVTQLISELVQCLLRLERTEEAEQALKEAEEILGKTQAQSHWFEIQRLRGQLHEATGDREQAAICYQRALEWSRLRRAKLFELRAGTSLARLWRDEGQRVAARELLAPVYGWFTGGFDGPDLKQARALLDAI